MMIPLLALLALSPPQSTQTGSATQDSLQQRDVRVLDLSGTPHERGLAHGRALKDEIQEMVSDFRNDLERTYRVDSSTFIDRFIDDTDFMPAIQKWTPGLLEEVRGIAEGSEMSFEEIYVWQLADEIWSMGSWAMREKCTAIAVDPRGGLRLAQHASLVLIPDQHDPGPGEHLGA